MNDRLGADERFWHFVFGVGITWLAITSAMKVGQYPAGDFRNEPLFWVVALGFSAVFGGLAIVSGLRGGPRVARRPIGSVAGGLTEWMRRRRNDREPPPIRELETQDIFPSLDLGEGARGRGGEGARKSGCEEVADDDTVGPATETCRRE